MIRNFFLFVLLFSFQSNAFAQGLLLDQNPTEHMEKYSPDKLGFTEIIPTKFSLRKYCPEPISQEGNTCAGFSIAYEAMNAFINYRLQITNNLTKSFLAFDPYFLYGLIKSKYSFQCNDPVQMYKAFDILESIGAKREFAPPLINCETDITIDVLNTATPYCKPYKLTDAFSLDFTNSNAIGLMKQAISGGFPIPIGVAMSDDINIIKNCIGADGLWKNCSAGAGQTGHAMCIIGYDDLKFGGAFEIMNSWGTSVGDQGFIWMKYSDALKSIKEAYLFDMSTIKIPSCFLGNCLTNYSHYRFDDFTRYEGELNDKIFDGFGYYINSDGTGTAGFWVEGKKSGPSFIFTSTGTYYGKYKDGVLIESKSLGFANQSTPEETELMKVYNYYKDGFKIKMAEPDEVDFESATKNSIK